MPNDLDQLKKILEIKILQNEIKAQKYFPVRLFAFWQAIVPSLFTLLSVGGTVLILHGSKFFENANTLYEIKNARLRDDSTGLAKTLIRMNDSVGKINSHYDSLKNDYEKLKIESENVRTTLNDEKGKLDKYQKENANLKTDLDLKTAALLAFNKDYHKSMNQYEQSDDCVGYAKNIGSAMMKLWPATKIHYPNQ